MFQGKTRTSAVALLTVAGGLLAAAPALITPDVAAAAERVIGQKTVGGPDIRPRKVLPPPDQDKGKNSLRPRGERGIIIWMRNKTKGERGIILQKRPRQK